MAVLFSVFIPTYNRSESVKRQVHGLRHLVEHARLQLNLDIEILISDNHSKIPVVVESEGLDLRIVRPEKHLETAEENLRFGIPHCRGEYVWVLADEDPPIVQNVIELFRRVLETRPCFVVANATGSLVDGTHVNSRTVASRAQEIRTFPDFVQKTGLWFVSAGVSCLVFQRDRVVEKLDLFSDYISISRIYAHSFWLLDVFWGDTNFMFFDLPIVVYRQNKHDVADDHWEKCAVRDGVFSKYYWTTSFVRHARLLRRNRKIPLGFFAQIIDQNWLFRFHLLSMVARSFFDQMVIEATAKKRLSRAVSESEIKEISDFLIEEDPRFTEFVSGIQDWKYDANANPRLVPFRAFYELFFVKLYGDWSVYQFDGLYRAIPTRFSSLGQDLFRDIAPLETPYHQVDENLDLLLSRLGALELPPEEKDDDLELKRDLRFLRRLVALYERLKIFIPFRR